MPNATDLCDVPGCCREWTRKKFRLCDMHYQQVRRGKTPGPSRYAKKTTRTVKEPDFKIEYDLNNSLRASLIEARDAYRNAVGLPNRMKWGGRLKELEAAWAELQEAAGLKTKNEVIA